VEQQLREQGAGLGAADGYGNTVVRGDLERPEDPELHGFFRSDGRATPATRLQGVRRL
jgi:hypothetical protein